MSLPYIRASASAFTSLICGFALAQAPAGQPQMAVVPPLLPGIAPPKVRVNEWVAGPAVEEFKSKKVYVFEFFRSRSKACRNYAKVYSQLADKFRKKATFAAISILESDQANLTPYMKDVAPKPDYSVASDSQATPKDGFGFMSQNWFFASGVNDLPAIVIIGKDQKVAWMGKAAEAEDSLAKVCDGKWDTAAFSAQLKAKAAKILQDSQAWNQHPVKLQLDKIGQLMRGQKGEEALQEIDKLAAMDGKDSRLNPQRYAAYYKVMVYTGLEDLENFYKAASDLLDICTDEAGLLNNTAWTIVDPKSQMPDKHWDLAIKLAERATTVDKAQSAYWDTLGWAYFGNGQKDKAIEAEKKAVELSEDLDQEDEYRGALAKFGA